MSALHLVSEPSPRAAAPGRFVTSDGTALRVVESGPADADVTVVLLHCWVADHRTWDDVVAHLAPDVRVLRYDHRAHGRSATGPRGTATVEQLGDDLAEVIADRAPTGRLVLAGHSIGGMTIMALAENHPELIKRRVAGVAFVATSSGGLVDGVLAALPKRLVAPVLWGEGILNRRIETWDPVSRIPDVVVRTFLRGNVFGKRPRRADLNLFADQLRRASSAAMAGFRDSLGQHERRAALAAFRGTPAVVLAGGLDRLTPVGAARTIARELPDAGFVVYPDAGHMLPQERSAEVASRIAGLAQRASE